MVDSTGGDAVLSPDGQWLYDWFSPYEYTAHRIRGVRVDHPSPHQRIRIVDTVDYGACLILDDEVQSYEADEFIYHEALVHPPLLLHREPRAVLVIGGGEGATLREVLRHRSVRRVLMVDLDRDVVEVCRRELPTFHAGAYEDPRAELRFGDGREFLERTEEAFDAILVDINNPLAGGPAVRLFTVEFYRAAAARLRPGGVLGLQAGAAAVVSARLVAVLRRTLAEVMPAVHPYLAHVPSFTVDWSFLVAGPAELRPVGFSAAHVDRFLSERVEGELRFYDGETHERLFRLPKYLRRTFATETRVSRDAAPFVERYPGYTPGDDTHRAGP